LIVKTALFARQINKLFLDKEAIMCKRKSQDQHWFFFEITVHLRNQAYGNVEAGLELIYLEAEVQHNP